MERHMETKKVIFPQKSTHYNQKEKEKRDEKKREKNNQQKIKKGKTAHAPLSY